MDILVGSSSGEIDIVKRGCCFRGTCVSTSGGDLVFGGMRVVGNESEIEIVLF